MYEVAGLENRSHRVRCESGMVLSAQSGPQRVMHLRVIHARRRFMTEYALVTT